MPPTKRKAEEWKKTTGDGDSVKYLQQDQEMLSDRTVFGILQSARKSKQQELVQKCLKYIKDQLKVENACAILEKAHEYAESEIGTSALEYIEDHAVFVLESGSIQSLCNECMGKVLGSDNLLMEVETPEDASDYGKGEEYLDQILSNLPGPFAGRPNFLYLFEKSMDRVAQLGKYSWLEHRVMKALIKWANKQCEVQHLEASGKTMRTVIGDLLFKVRFGFCSKYVINTDLKEKGVITAEEAEKLLKGEQLDSFPKYSNRMRGPHEYAKEYSVYDGISLVHESPTTETETITFECMQQVSIHGFSVYGLCRPSPRRKVINVKVKLSNSFGQVVAEANTKLKDPWSKLEELQIEEQLEKRACEVYGIVPRFINRAIRPVLFHRSVALEPSVKYTLEVRVSSASRYCGQQLQTVLKKDETVLVRVCTPNTITLGHTQIAKLLLSTE